MRRAFTLVELLVVLVIISIVAVLAVTAYSSMQHAQVSQGARLLQAALAGARDRARLTGRPAGIRLLPDPILNGRNPKTGRLDPRYPLVYNRWIPIEAAPDYAEGLLSPISSAEAKEMASKFRMAPPLPPAQSP